MPLPANLHAPVSELSFYSIDLFPLPTSELFFFNKVQLIFFIMVLMESCHEHWISESGPIAPRENIEIGSC